MLNGFKSAPVISEYKNFSLSPAIVGLHYGLQVCVLCPLLVDALW